MQKPFKKNQAPHQILRSFNKSCCFANPPAASSHRDPFIPLPACSPLKANPTSEMGTSKRLGGCDGANGPGEAAGPWDTMSWPSAARSSLLVDGTILSGKEEGRRCFAEGAGIFPAFADFACGDNFGLVCFF